MILASLLKHYRPANQGRCSCGEGGITCGDPGRRGSCKPPMIARASGLSIFISSALMSKLISLPEQKLPLPGQSFFPLRRGRDYLW